MPSDNALRPAQRVGLFLIRVQIALGLTVALFLAIELWAGRQLRREDSFERPLEYFWTESDAHGDEPWLDDYLKEYQSSRTRWCSYLYWQRLPSEGRYINVDTNGIRLTVSREAPVNAGPPRMIYLFGGSTVWGEGVRDEFTIASRLQDRLRARGVNAVVLNQGEGGYVNTQELIKFMLLERNGQRPHLAIFLDGMNDVFAAYESGVAGIPQNEANRVLEFNLSARLGTVLRMAVLGGNRGWNIARILRKWRYGSASAVDAGPGSAERLAALAAECWRLYEGNGRLIKQAASAAGCRTLFYWQPYVSTKTHRTPFEEKLREAAPPGLETINALAYEQARSNMTARPELGFYIADVFDGIREPRFIDYCHVSETGNDEIAARMVRDVLPLLAASAAE